MKNLPQINFKKTLCQVVFSEYHNPKGRRAIILESLDGTETEAVATINCPEIDLQENEVVIKNYSENEGILEVLINAKIIRDTGKEVPDLGAPICKIIWK